MRLVLFRSARGLNLRADAARACASVRAAGFDGIEASLTDIGGSQTERRVFGKAAQAEGLELILSAYSSWDSYEGEVSAHVSTMLKELESLADLNGSLSLQLRLVNAHSGSDAWSEAQACEYFGAIAQASDAGLGGALPPVAHETHRGRYLCCPFTTARLLQRVPSLRLTSDLSHWVLKAEGLLDAPEEARLLHCRITNPNPDPNADPDHDPDPDSDPDQAQLLRSCIAPAVDHIHARLGAPQLSDPRDPRHALAAARFYAFWAECWSAREAAAVSGRAAVATATVEYGSPLEYGARGDYAGHTPVDHAGAPVAGCRLDTTLASASAELRHRFDVWHRDVSRRMDL